MIIIYIDAIERYRFFTRLSVPIGETHFVTHLLSIYFLCLIAGRKCTLIKGNKEDKLVVRKFDTLDDIAVGSVFSSNIYTKIHSQVNDIFAKEKYDVAFVWNGMRVFQRAFSDACQQNNINIKFFEITNLPGKIQVNSKGVNFQSDVLSELNSKKLTEHDESKWSSWKLAYQERDKNPAGQVGILKKINWYFILDRVGSFCTLGLNVESKSVFKKIHDKLSYINFEYEVDELGEEKFAFFPLQVSTDSQVLINYDKSLINALTDAIEIANMRGMKLVVKPHPAETDVGIINEILALKSNYGFLVSNFDVSTLILQSEFVITINSSVGLESLLFDKETVFLGDSIYSGISNAELECLILECFVSVDYFGYEPVCLKILGC